MHHVQIGLWKFRYIVGPHSVGIISPTRAKYTATIEAVRQAALVNPGAVTYDDLPGSSDVRVTPGEIASYILSQQLK
jgi:hypothetical protein